MKYRDIKKHLINSRRRLLLQMEQNLLLQQLKCYVTSPGRQRMVSTSLLKMGLVWNNLSRLSMRYNRALNLA